MGYACPVCDDPQADARHLANHLAFTAILGDNVHEAWLDDHAPGWADEGESELAERIADEAEQREYPQVFEDTTGGTREGDRAGELFESEGHGHSHEHSPSTRATDEVPYQQAEVTPDDETETILDEARAMTREMLGDEATDDETDAEDADDAATSDG
ncbi:hypothetical protein BRD04_02255 [Halobacteriales archaeon QS_9_67_17]|nr:MAG: hypothetical protein BRD04_02255 [Halobacteriales archaeon QS_9_67_17]